MKFKLISARYFVKGYEYASELEKDGFEILNDALGSIKKSPEIEISTLEDLIALSKRYGKALVVETNPIYCSSELPEITIYNDYLE